MKLLLSHITALVLIVGGLSLDCKTCQEGTMDEGEGFFKMTDDIFEGLDPGPCKGSDAEDMKTCDAESDICVRYNTAYRTGGVMFKRTRYECGTDSEDNVEGNSPECQGRINMAPTEGFSDFTCETVVTTAKEETSGGDEGEREDEDCQKEMCSGGKAPQFLLATASVLLYGMF